MKTLSVIAGTGFDVLVDPVGSHPSTGLRWVVFVHGFNTGRGEAEEQAATLFGRDAPQPGTEQFLFAWPSVAPHVGPLSRLSYPAAIVPALESGRMLGDYLARRDASDVVLIGHSLGALVAIEACRRWREQIRYGDLAALLLTGAAIPEHTLERQGLYFWSGARREIVLHSHRDSILVSVFRLGQKLANPFEPASSAVGLLGGPADRNWERFDARRVDHRYWRHPETRDALDAIERERALPGRRRLRRWELSRRRLVMQ